MSDRTEVWEPIPPKGEPVDGATDGGADATQPVPVDGGASPSSEPTRALPVEEPEPTVGLPPPTDDATEVVPVHTGPPTVAWAAPPRPTSPEVTAGVRARVSDPATPPTAGAPPAPTTRPPARTGDRLVTGPRPLPLGAMAAVVGQYRWIEHTLFVLLGRWVEDAPLASVRVHLDAQSLRHAWHAELWADRLPVLAGTDPDRLTVPSAPAAALFGLLGADVPASVGSATGELDADPGMPDSPSVGTVTARDRPGTLPRLAALYRVVLPRLVSGYEGHLAAAADVTDGPVIRALRLVLNDEIEDWRAGERLVQHLVARPHDVEVVMDFQRRLESAIVAAGAASGLVRVPGDGARH